LLCTCSRGKRARPFKLFTFTHHLPWVHVNCWPIGIGTWNHYEWTHR